VAKKDKTIKDIIAHCRAPQGAKVRLKDYDPGWRGSKEMRALLGDKDEEEQKECALQILEQNRKKLGEAQARLSAQDRYGVLVVIQAIDAAGKDGTIKHVMSGLNPQGTQVVSFKTPSAEELDHDFLWRCYKALPERGQIGIFNRSHYEEVLAVRVHPEFLEGQKLPPGKRGKKFWKQRYQSINDFERHLVRNGFAVVKFFLHISKEEQKKRFLARLDDPEKNWKFSAADVAEREFWDGYTVAFEEAISATSTRRAPWYIIPGDHKWIARTLVAEILAHAILDLDVDYPEPSEEEATELEAARDELLAEA
jgi:PPK2 family polyphosphate:nucleotide phosphotransferase